MQSRQQIRKLAVYAGAIVVVALTAALVARFGLSLVSGQKTAKLTGTLQLPVGDGTMCQRFVIDNTTGLVSQEQPVPCREPASDSKQGSAKDSRSGTARDFKRPAESSEPRYSSGSRIDAVRDSFNNR